MDTETYQRNIRLIHHVTEFLDLDSAKSSPKITEFISLIDALREGLQQIDEGFRMPDTQINVLFLTKLKSRPEWSDWAGDMMRDPRLTSSDPVGRMGFQELAERAVERERVILGESVKGDSYGHGRDDASKRTSRQSGNSPTPRILSQDEINEFVMRKMNQDNRDGQPHRAKRHFKRPSQDEINEYVVRQMRREQERATRNRSQSLPVSRQPRCGFCGDPSHGLSNCWRRWRVAAEAPPGDFTPKRVEFRTEIPGHPPIYRTGFSLY